MTEFLFAHPSFLSGAARALDLGGVFDDYNVSETPAEADARALQSDVEAVAGDMKLAIADATQGLPEGE